MADGLHKVEADNTFETHGAAAIVSDEKLKAKRKKLLLALGGTVAAAALAAGLHWAFIGSHYVSTENAYVDASTAQVSAQLSGAVAAVHVNETEQVHAGDLLAVIDPADAQLALAQAEAEYRRTLQRVRQYYAQEAAAAANVSAAQAEFERTSVDFRRRSALAETGAISAEELSSSRAASDAARAGRTSAGQALAAQRALTQGVSVDQHPETLAARAALEAARLAVSRTEIRAPIDGVVAQLNANVGQRIEPGQPLMVIAPIADAYVDANFKESQLRNVRIGQPVHLTSDLYGHDVVYHGRVAGIGGGTGSAFAIIPAQNATGNWLKVVQRVPVRIELDPRELAEHPLRVGLSMEARIDVSRD